MQVNSNNVNNTDGTQANIIKNIIENLLPILISVVVNKIDKHIAIIAVNIANAANLDCLLPKNIFKKPI